MPHRVCLACVPSTSILVSRHFLFQKQFKHCSKLLQEVSVSASAMSLGHLKYELSLVALLLWKTVFVPSFFIKPQNKTSQHTKFSMQMTSECGLHSFVTFVQKNCVNRHSIFQRSYCMWACLTAETQIRGQKNRIQVLNQDVIQFVVVQSNTTLGSVAEGLDRRTDVLPSHIFFGGTSEPSPKRRQNARANIKMDSTFIVNIIA